MQKKINKNFLLFPAFDFKIQRGFTLLEVIFTILLFIIGILGTYLIVQEPIFFIQKSVSRLTASYLAQEGIEIVRNIRDENWLKERSWYYGLNQEGQWQASYNDSELHTIPVPTQGLLFLDADGFYNHDDTGIPTKFKRRIKIECEPDCTEENLEYLKVTVKTEWQEHGKTSKVEVREDIHPWWPY